MVLQRMKNDKRKYELVETPKERDEILGELNTYIISLLHFLWKQPKFVSNLLSKANNKDVKECLAHFFANNLYENILSKNNKEEQLLYIITSLLKKEINNIDINNLYKSENLFLNETPCGHILKELSYKKDIQSYFRIIIIDLIEKLELSYSSQEIVFDPGRIKDIILLEKKEEEKDDSNKTKNDYIFERKTINEELEKQSRLFDVKYKFGLPKEELEKKLKENENNKNMKEYINDKISNCSKKHFIYSTEILLENINFTKINNSNIDLGYSDDDRKELSSNILSIYKQNFFEAISVIDKLFDNLISNIHFLPYSIKCINKIIAILINKKYPNLSTFQKNIFIAKFFFGKLFLPIFGNPAISALINDFIISDNTIVNISKIISIVYKFISGQFYEDIIGEGIFTPFNWYFLNKMPILLDFFEKSTNVKLPHYIETIIDNEENEYDYNYEFNYFEENEDKMMCIKNICFSYDDFYYLYYNIIDNKDELFKINCDKTKKVEKALEKLISNEYIIEKIKELCEKIPDSNNANKAIRKKNTIEKELDNKPRLKFFLYSDLVFNDKYKDLFNIENKKKYFNLKYLKNCEPHENNIIKAKNFICDFLYNFHSLDIIDFNTESQEKNKLNTMNLLKELKKYIKSSDLLNDETIPSQWYINSIIEYLKKLPQNLIENDYSELFSQLEEDINNSIKLINFDKIGLFTDQIKLAKKSHLFYYRAKKIMTDIDLNQQVHNILEKEEIPVQIKFVYSENEKKFEIAPHPGYVTVRDRIGLISRFFYSYEKKICQTIKEFTNIFPNLSEYNALQDINIFEILEELKIPSKLMKYFEYIGEKIKNLEIVSENKFNTIQIKIYDYVMEKLYDKIFPKEAEKEDLLIFKNCVRCSWIELKHLVGGKNDYILENFIPDTIKNFDKINREKSPRKKLKCVNEIFKCIYNVAQLNGDKIDGTDDSLNLLWYAFIKASPFCIYSNCKFMNLFLGAKKNEAEGHQLSQLLGICQETSNISAASLLDVSEEQFNKNCLLALKE